VFIVALVTASCKTKCAAQNDPKSQQYGICVFICKQCIPGVGCNIGTPVGIPAGPFGVAVLSSRAKRMKALRD
jgi:hypothetical protein